MLGKMVFFAIGYVMGTRAGRERWDEMVRAARWVAQREEVQTAAGMAAGAARTGVERGRDRLGAAIASRRQSAAGPQRRVTPKASARTAPPTEIHVT